MTINRRGFLFGGGALILTAPAVIRIPGLLMPIKQPLVTKVWADDNLIVDFELLDPGMYNMTLKDLVYDATMRGICISFRVGDKIIHETVRL